MPTPASTIMASNAKSENTARLFWPCGSTTQAASSGPNDAPALPPTWKIDCARPCRPPEAMRATRDASGWKIDGPLPTSAAAASSSGNVVACDSNSSPARVKSAQRQRERLWMTVGIRAHQRLQQRGGELEGQRDQADLREAEMETALEQRIARDQQRLHGVVEKMREADRAQYLEGGTVGGGMRGRHGGRLERIRGTNLGLRFLSVSRN